MVEEASFIKSEYIIILKKALAKELYEKKIDQLKISEILGLSQSMISNYLSSNKKIPKNISNLASEITDKIIHEKTASFYTCISFSDNILEGTLFVANKNELLNDENQKIVNYLSEAFSILKGKDVSRILPKIKINIAMAKKDARDSEDVASFLNGLIVADDKVISHNGIRFGKSKHLSSLILNLKKRVNINSIMNIAYVKSLKNTNFKVGYFTKDYNLKGILKDVDILLHKGDFGIEPCAYVLGSDAVDVSNKVLRIIEDE